MSCLPCESGFQPYPQTGKLKDNSNLSLTHLRDLLSKPDGAVVYSYVVRTIKRQSSDFVQSGSGPNFQGDLITLCTCKPLMRTSLDVDSWCGVWIAGFSGVNETDRGNGLVYLIRVGRAFDSHCDLWQWLPSKTRQAKAAHLHKLGDVSEPKAERIHSDGLSRFEPGNYKPPRDGHSHATIESNSDTPRWHKDVNYQGYRERRAALLVGDPETSFLWSRPIVFFAGRQHPRTKKWTSPQEFLNHLTD